MRILWLLIFALQVFHGFCGVPMVLEYQGQLVEASTNRAVAEPSSRNMLFIISEAGGADLYSYSAPSVSIRDGRFRVEIPIPDSLKFDKPYAINVILQGQGGGQTGPQALKAVPYALTSKDAFQLEGIDASEFSRASHVHTTSSGKIFTIDGVNQALLPGDPQFTILDEGGRILFRINAEGTIERVSSVSATGTIETSGSLAILINGSEKFRAEPDGDIRLTGNLEIGGQMEVQSIQVSTMTTFSDLLVRKTLELLDGTTLSVQTNTGNAIGLAHTLEDHAESELLTRLKSLVAGVAVTSGLHTHSFEASELTSQALLPNAVESQHIVTGSLFDADVGASALILDSRLATISTTGKVTTNALPSTMVLKGQDNVFGAGFGASGGNLINTTNFFDAMTLSELLISAPQILGTAPILEFTNQAGEFTWKFYRDGRVSLMAAGGTAEVFSIEVTENDTKFDLKAVDLVLKEGYLIQGAVIQDGTLSGSDIMAGQLSGSDIQDSSVATIKISSQTVTTAKLSPGAVVSEKINGLSVGTRHIQAGSISTAKIATGAITGEKILNGSLTGAVFADGQIAGSRILDGDLGGLEIRDGSLNQNVLASENPAGGVFPLTGVKLQSEAIGPEHLKDEVARDRSTPAQISSTPSSITTPLLRLRSNSANRTLLKMEIDQIQSVPLPAVQLITSLLSGGNQNLFSLNMNGSMTLRGNNLSNPVTVPGDIMAVISGASKPSGKCPVNDDYEHVSFGAGTKNAGTGFCIRRFTNSGAGGFSSGAFDCPASGVTGIQGARLCTMDELRMACQAGKIATTGAVMSGDLGYGGGQLRYQQLNVTSTSPCQAAIAGQNLGTVGAYACCFVPR